MINTIPMNKESEKREKKNRLIERGTYDLSFKEQVKMNRYSKLRIVEELSYGLSSTLFLALNELNQKVVIKIFNRSSHEAYIKEREFFKSRPNFQNIVKIFDNGLIKKRKDPYFGHYYLVMEYAEKGDLANYIEKKYNNIDEAKKLFKQILNGYEEINNCGFIHRDLKPENILILDDDTLKITDFGFTEKIDCLDSNKIIGTEGYMPPEVLKKENIIPELIDVFSLGVILFLLIVGYFPFEEPNEQDELYRLIIEENWDEYWRLVDSNNIFSQDLKNLIQGMICNEPNKRFNIEKIKSCEWLSNDVSESSPLIKN